MTAEVAGQLESLTKAVKMLVRVHGIRLTRQEVCDRLGVHRNTLPKILLRGFPRPDPTGKWLLADIMEWESTNDLRNTRVSR